MFGFFCKAVRCMNLFKKMARDNPHDK
jgi:hypothetical protein